MVTGLARISVLRAVSVKVSTVMTVCNPPHGNILGINRTLEGISDFDKVQAATRVPINTLVLCP
jgi:D-mannonate dehydratase